MIRNLITLIFFFIVGWLVYTQVLGLGSTEEQETGKELVQNAKKTISSVFGILGNEGKKFKNGTYDDAIDQLGSLLDNLRAKNNGENTELQAQLDELKQEEERIKVEITSVKESKMNNDTPNEEDAEKEAKTTEDLKNLTKDIQKVIKLMKIAGE